MKRKLTKKTRLPLILATLAIFALGPIVFFTLKNAKKAAAEWWNGDYKYRTRYSYTATAAVTSERKVKIDVDTATLITATKMQSDCDDVRFTDSTGKLLDYFIDTNTADCNNASTDFYVKVPSVAVGGNLIYMYYGNAAVSRSDLGGRKNYLYDDAASLSTSLVGYWKLNETTANTCTDGGTTDSCDSTIVGNNHGSWTGNATYTASGKLNGAVTLDGTLDYVSIADPGAGSVLDMTSAITLSVWLKSSSASNTYIMTKTGDSFFLGHSISGGGTGPCFWLNGPSAAWLCTGTSIADGNWHLITATYNGSTLIIYVDGVSATSSSRSGAISTGNSPVLIGARLSGGGEWNGQLDDVRIYNQALSATEVATLYNSGNGQESPPPPTFTPSSGPTAASEETTPGPIAYWKFDEGTGQTTNDQTTHNNDGTLGANASVASDDPTWKQESDCVSGKCLQFDGSADYVTTNVTLADNVAWTVSMWVKPNTLPTYSGLYGNLFTASNLTRFFYGDATDPTIYLYNDSGSNVSWAGTLTAHRWQHVVLVSNGSDSNNITLYINNVSKGVKTLTDSSQTIKKIGSLGSTSSFLHKGFLDEIKIYPYARSAAEIKADYNGGASVLGLSDSKDYLSDGLVGYWKMDESSGNAADSSGNSTTLTNTGTTTYISGRFGNAGNFNGFSQYEYAADSATLSLTSHVTLSTWIKPDNYPFGDSVLIGKWDGSNESYLLTQNDAGIRMYIDSSSNYQATTVLSMNPTEWYHIVGVYNATTATVKIYVNGTEAASSTTGTIPSSIGDDAGRLHVGAEDSSTSATSFYDGMLDEARIYNRPLSSDDVRNLYNWGPDPFAYYKMDETSANTCSGGVNDSCEAYGSGVDGAWTNVSSTTGKINSGTLFSNDSISLGTNSIFDFTGSMTISMWANVDSYNSTFQNYLVSNGFTEDGEGYYLRLWSTGSVQFLTGNGAASFNNLSATVTAASLVNTWNHFAISVDSTTSKMYLFINGILSGSLTYSAIDMADTLESLLLGAGNGGFNGRMDEVRFYNYARTQTQITEDMNANHPAGGSPVGSQILQYQFDEQQGTTANNSITGIVSTAGTISGATWKTKDGGPCKINGCLDFDGTDDVTTITNTNNIDLNVGLVNGFTFSSWIYADSDGEGDVGQIFQKGTTTYCRTDTESGGRVDIQCSLDLATTDATLNISSAIATGSWNHVAMSWTDDSDDEISIWINGNLRGTSTDGSGAPATDTANLLIGGTTTANFDGKIDHFNLYGAELSVDTIRIDMNANSALSYSVLGSSEAVDVSDGAGTDPAFYMQFNEKTGQTAYDVGGSSYTGTLGANGSVAADDPTWISVTSARNNANDLTDGALSFDGSDDYVVTTYAPNYSALTWEAWIKTTSATEGCFLGAKRNGGNQVARMCLGTGTGSSDDSKLRVLIADDNGVSSGDPGVYSTTSINDGIWHHVVVTASATGTKFVRLYIDGNLENNTTVNFTGNINVNTALLIGAYNNAGTPTSFLNASIDAVKLYNYARTQAQISYDFNRGAPAAHWRMDECQGSTIFDASGNGNNGTATIGASGTQTSVGTCSTSSTAWGNGATGKFGASLNFDNTDDWILGGSTPVYSANGKITLAAWIKPNTITQFDGIVSKSAASGFPGWLLEFESSNRLAFVSAGGAVAAYSSNNSVTTGVWQHVAVTYDSANGAYALYVNGKNVGSGTDAGSISDSGYSLAIGRLYYDTNNYYFDGQIDDVRIYNYPLSASQVKKVFNEGSAVRYGANN